MALRLPSRTHVTIGLGLLLAAAIGTALLVARPQHQSRADRVYRKMLSQEGHAADITASVLAGMGDPRAIPKLKEIMQSDDDAMKALAVEAAAKIDHPEVLDILLAGASSKGWNRVNGESLRSLRQTGLVNHPKAVCCLFQRAESNDDVALACIVTLAYVRPPVTERLIEMFERIGDRGTLLKRQRIIDALGRIGDEAALAKLKSIEDSSDRELAERATKALNPPKEKPVPPGEPPDFWKRVEEREKQTKEDLYGRDKDPYISVMICMVMHYVYDDNAQMVEEAKAHMRHMMDGPAKVRDHELGILKGLLKHKDPKVRAAAAKALEYCKSIEKEKAPGAG